MDRFSFKNLYLTSINIMYNNNHNSGPLFVKQILLILKYHYAYFALNAGLFFILCKVLLA